jgi:hypothetical protein
VQRPLKKSSSAPQRWLRAILFSLSFLSSFRIQKFITSKKRYCKKLSWP